MMIFNEKIFRRCLTVLFLVLCLQGGWFLARKVYISAKMFADAGLDYDTLRRQSEVSLAALRTRELLPPRADVSLPPSQRTLSKVLITYLLFPHRIVESSHYLLDWNQRVTVYPPGWERIPLTSNIFLYVHGKEVKPLSPSPYPKLPLAVLLPGVVCFFAYNVLLGSFVLQALHIARCRYDDAWYYMTSYLLGYVVSTTMIWLLLLAGMKLTAGSVLFCWGTLCVLAGWIPCWQRTSREKQILQSQDNVATQGKILTAVTGWILFLVLSAIFVVAVSSGVSDWDGMSHWILKSKVFYYYQGLRFDATHLNSYPLLWPLNIACQFVLMGGMFDELAKWTAGFFFLAFVVQLEKSLQYLGLKTHWRRLILVFYVVSAFHDILKPWWYVHFVFANAENMFLALWAAVLTLVIRWVKDKKQTNALWLALIFMAGLNLTKVEGMVATGILGVVMSVLFRREIFCRKGRLSLWLCLAFLSLAVPVGWWQWLKWQGYSPSFSHMQEGLSLVKLFLLFKINLKHSFVNNMPILTLLLGIYVLVFRRASRWSESDILLGLISAGMIFFTWGAHIGYSSDEMKVIPPEVFIRLFLHATPPLVLFFSSRLSSAHFKD